MNVPDVPNHSHSGELLGCVFHNSHWHEQPSKLPESQVNTLCISKIELLDRVAVLSNDLSEGFHDIKVQDF